MAAPVALAQRLPDAALMPSEQACVRVADLPGTASQRREARRLWQQAAARGDARGQACALYADALAQGISRDPAVMHRLERVARFARSAGSVWVAAAAEATAGQIRARTGEPAQGMAQIRRALAFAATARGRERAVAPLEPLSALAYTLLSEGDASGSRNAFARLSREARAAGAPGFAGLGAAGGAAIALDQGDLAAAADLLARAQEDADAEGRASEWHLDLAITRARLDDATGRLDEAVARLRPVAATQAALGDSVAASFTYHQIGGVYRHDPTRWRDAVRAYRTAYDLVRRRPERYKARLLEALVLYEVGQVDAARRAARPAADSVAAAPLDVPENALAYLMLARDARLGGRPADALRYAARSTALAERSGIRDTVVDGLAELALAREATGDVAGALAAYRRSTDLSDALQIRDQARAAGQTEARVAFERDRAVEAVRRTRLVWGWALTLALAAVAAVAAAVYVRATRRRAARSRQQAGALRRANAAQTRFLANISHELRTPLTLLLGPLDDLRDGRFAVAPEAQPLLERAGANGQRLRRLIDDLLTLARADADALALRRQPLDAAAFVRDRVAAFGSGAAAGGVDLAADGETVRIAADPGLLETVVYNLVANALKFTPPGGEVRVMTRPLDGGAEIAVSDTGAGIAPDDLARLFDRFFQADTAQARAGEGAGIGLALAREIAERHGGTIAAESTPGAGTTVRVWLPAGTPDVPAVATVASPAPRLEPWPAGDGLIAPDAPHDADPDGPVDADGPGEDDRPLVLVVEDNADLRAYLRAILAPRYRVEEAPDGAAGLARAIETVPDLVLSDVMMPEMDGVAMLTALKGDVRTSHVPVVLLTARADVESRIDGLDRGADDYLAKPFAAREVEARVANLVAGRRALRERWARRGALEPAPAEMPSEEVVFLDGLRGLAEAHLGDADFGVDALADALVMSPRQLARKLRALTDETPGALLRRLRMARAAEMLRAGRAIPDVAAAVGFSGRTQFGRAFRDAFGVSPSAFAGDAVPEGSEGEDASQIGG